MVLVKGIVVYLYTSLYSVDKFFGVPESLYLFE